MKIYTNVYTYKDKILFRYIDTKTNERHIKLLKDFSKIKLIRGYKYKNGNYIDRFGHKATIKTFNTINEWRDAKDLPLFNIDPAYQIIFQLYKNKEIINPIDKLSIMNIDIEVMSSDEFPTPDKVNYPIVSIVMQDMNKDKYYILAWNETSDEFYNEEENIIYIHCKDEIDLLKKFIKIWKGKKYFYYPDIVTGWYIEGFDIPYLINRIKKLLDEEIALKLSPINKITEREIKKGSKTFIKYLIKGIAILDYLELYKKYVGEQSSYALGYIAQHEIGETKVEYDDYGKLYDLYIHNFQKFIEYNLQDVKLVYKIDKKLKLLYLLTTIAYLGRANYEDVLGTVKYFDAFFTYEAWKKGVLI